MILALLAVASAAELVSLEIEPGRVSRASLVGVVEVPAEEVLAVIVDCARGDEWFPDARRTRAIVTPSGGLRCEGQTDLPWPVPDRAWQIDLEVTRGAPIASVSFRYVEDSGNLQALAGRYTIERLDPHRTRVTYEAEVDLGFWVPAPLVEWASRRLPDLLSGLERQARRVGAP